MTLEQIKDWLKGFEIFDYYYIGTIDSSKEKVLGVYANGRTMRPVHALGSQSTYNIAGIKILVHWNKDEQDSQNAACELFRNLSDVVAADVGNNLIHYVDLQVQEPLSVGRDEHGIYEFVINANIYYRR